MSSRTYKLPHAVTTTIGIDIGIDRGHAWGLGAKSAIGLPRIVVFGSVGGGSNGGRARVNDPRVRKAREGARARNRAPPLFITLRAARSAPATRGGAEAAFRAAGSATLRK